MATIKFHGIKILKQREGDGIVIDSTIDGKGDSATGPLDHTAPVHEDLVNAIWKLAPHYALLTGIIPATEIPSGDYKKHDDELRKRIYVSGYSISTQGKTEGFMIKGHFYNFREKACIINTPFEPFGSDNGYPLISEVTTIFQEIEEELRKYLGGKHGKVVVDPNPKQASMIDDKGQANGNTYPQGMSHASPEAQKRIQEDDALTERKRGGRKQTPANPSGGAD